MVTTTRHGTHGIHVKIMLLCLYTLYIQLIHQCFSPVLQYSSKWLSCQIYGAEKCCCITTDKFINFVFLFSQAMHLLTSYKCRTRLPQRSAAGSFVAIPSRFDFDCNSVPYPLYIDSTYALINQTILLNFPIYIFNGTHCHGDYV